MNFEASEVRSTGGPHGRFLFFVGCVFRCNGDNLDIWDIWASGRLDGEILWRREKKLNETSLSDQVLVPAKRSQSSTRLRNWRD